MSTQSYRWLMGALCLWAWMGVSSCGSSDREAPPPETVAACAGRPVRQGCPCEGALEQPCVAGLGACQAGVRRCGADGTWGGCEGEVASSPERCDHTDNDCDGEVDEGLLNSCGGCEDLGQAVGGTCGVCGRGTWTCESQEALRCQGDLGEAGRNGCGGCAELEGEPGAACDHCGPAQWVCDGLDAVRCEGGAPYDACGGCSGLLEIQVGEPCRSCGQYVCQGDVLICVPTDACDPNRVQTLVPDIELQDVGCVIGPADVNGDGIDDLVFSSSGAGLGQVYFGPIVDAGRFEGAPDVEFGESNVNSIVEFNAVEDVNGDGMLDALVTFRQSPRNFNDNMGVIWGPLGGEYCLDFCPITDEEIYICNNSVSGYCVDDDCCRCNVDWINLTTPVPCSRGVAQQRNFDFAMLNRDFLWDGRPVTSSPCDLPPGMLTGDVNGDGYTDLIKVDRCSPTGGRCEFSRVKVDLGPNNEDSDSCFLNPSVSECEVEFEFVRTDSIDIRYYIARNIGPINIDSILAESYLWAPGITFDVLDILHIGANGIYWSLAWRSPPMSIIDWGVGVGDLSGDGANELMIEQTNTASVAGNRVPLAVLDGMSLQGFAELWVQILPTISDCVPLAIGKMNLSGEDQNDLGVQCYGSGALRLFVFAGPIARGSLDLSLADWQPVIDLNEFQLLVSMGDLDDDQASDFVLVSQDGTAEIYLGASIVR